MTRRFSRNRERVPALPLLVAVLVTCVVVAASLVSTASAATSRAIIYSDSLASGWADWSFDATNNFSNTSPVRSGTYSIATTFHTAWAGLNLHTTSGINTTGYTSLEFWVNGGSGSGLAEQIALYNARSVQTQSPIPLNQFIQGGTITANHWRLVTVPLASLGGANQVITGILIQDMTGAAQPTLYVDDISLVGMGSVTGTPTPSATPTHTSTPGASPTKTPTPVSSSTKTSTPISSPSRTPTPVGSPTHTATATSTPPPTQTPSGSTNTMNGLHVSGGLILNGAGQTVLIHGVDRMSSEYACLGGYGFWDGGTPNQTEVNTMKTWNIDAVRIPLNEDCWLGINGAPAAYSGANYQNAIANYVALLQANNMVAIVDLHWNAPGSTLSNAQQAMADQDHAPAFWTSVANTLKGHSNAIFDLYNEPYPSSWSCLLNGGSNCGASFPIAGMQSLLNAVRATGATNPVMVGGLSWAHDLSQWTSYKPTDTMNPPQVIASWHNYNDGITCSDLSCWTNWNAAPLVGGEIGELDCGHSYIDTVVSTLNSHNEGYTAWSWGPYNCASNPALNTDWNGSPTQTYGSGYKNDIASLPSFR